MTRKYQKWALFVGALMLLWLGLQGVASAAPLASQTQRIYGTDRIGTAIAVAQAGWTQADTVLLARADDFPDSLVAIPLSRKLDAPILLTNTGGLDPQVLTEIKALRATHVILLGGDQALGNAVTSPLDAAGISWERIGGVNRYATAVAVAQRLDSASGQVILASGDNFPDALSIGAYAGVTQTPILLTSAKAMPEATLTELSALQDGVTSPQTLVIGGNGAIPDATLQGVPNITRLGGVDRFDTAAKVYLFAENVLTGMPAQTTAQTSTATGQPVAYVVTGENYPDALVAGALAAKENAPLFMATNNSLPAVTYSVMGNAAENNPEVYLIGGAGALSNQVSDIIQGTIQPDYLLSGMKIVVDPGHGGPDPGAMGADGTPEKVFNLAMGMDVANYLRQAGATVIMTRTTDVSPAGADYSMSSAVPDLQARVNIAEKANANLFICIHNNSATELAHGTETYYSPDSTLATQSARLAQDIQTETVNQIGLTDRGVKQANYYVLKNTTMPAILIEVGFITNIDEEKALASPDVQAKAALGIYRGILVYEGY